MSTITDLLDVRVPKPNGFKFATGPQAPETKLRVRCAFCRWGGHAATVATMREVYERHLELKHPERVR